MASHRECNFRGTSGGMEVKAAEILWNRSLERNLRYTTMVSDGDSKHLTNKRAKRLGTALHKLATSGKKAGVTLRGQGFGRLTQATIVKLTAYYGKAVRAHRGNLPAMTDAVWGTSSDEKPQHGRCTVGPNSWCFFTRRHLLPDSSQDRIARMWARLCLQTGFVGVQRVLSATCAAVAEFNSGVEVTMRVMPWALLQAHL